VLTGIYREMVHRQHYTTYTWCSTVKAADIIVETKLQNNYKIIIATVTNCTVICK